MQFVTIVEMTSATILDNSDLNIIDTYGCLNDKQFDVNNKTKKFKYVILEESDIIDNQIIYDNTIYEIKYDFNLEKRTISVPQDCVLFFNGGKLLNGKLVGNETNIQANIHNHIFDNVTMSGTFVNSEFYVDWFGASPGLKDNSNAIKEAINNAIPLRMPIRFNRGNYYVEKTIIVRNSYFLRLKGSNTSIRATFKQNIGVADDIAITGGSINLKSIPAVFAFIDCDYLVMDDFIINGGKTGTYTNNGIVIAGCSNMTFSNLYIENVISGILVYSMWMSNLKKIVCHNAINGFYYTSNRKNEKSGVTGTSNHFDNCWVNIATNAYVFDWLNYSTMTCCGADHVSVAYKFTGGTYVTMNGCASENCKSIFLWSNRSNVVANACQFMQYKGKQASVVLYNKSIVTITNSSFDNATFSCNNNNSIVNFLDCKVPNGNKNIWFTDEGGEYYIKEGNVNRYISYKKGKRIENIIDYNILR